MGARVTDSKAWRARTSTAILDAVCERINVNDRCSDCNGPDAAHQGGLRASSGCDFAARSPATPTASAYDAGPRRATWASATSPGAKLGTLKTYLQDAADAGARFVVNCRVERVLVEDGRAAGVEGTYTDEDGTDRPRRRARADRRRRRGRARHAGACCCAPGIGGPAAGDYLRLHPATAVAGIYDEPQKGWWGPPQTVCQRQFADVEDGYGFLIETSHATPGRERLGACPGSPGPSTRSSWRRAATTAGVRAS